MLFPLIQKCPVTSFPYYTRNIRHIPYPSGRIKSLLTFCLGIDNSFPKKRIFLFADTFLF